MSIPVEFVNVFNKLRLTHSEEQEKFLILLLQYHPPTFELITYSNATKLTYMAILDV